MKKYIILTILIACMGVGLIACKGKSDETEISAGTAASEQQSSDYQKLSILIPDHIKAKDFVLTETDIVLLDGNGIARINYDGVIHEEIPLPDSESFARFSIDEKGNFNILALSYNDEGNIESLTAHCFHSSGSVWKPKTKLKGSFAEEEEELNAGATPSIVDYLTVGGYHYVQTLYGIYVYDKAGELILRVLEENNERQRTLGNGLFLTEDGLAASVSSGWMNETAVLVVRLFEAEPKDFTEHIISGITTALPAPTQLAAGGGLDFLVYENRGLNEYGLDAGWGNQIINLAEHGITNSEFYRFSLTDAGDIICVLPRGSLFYLNIAGEIAVFSADHEHVRGTMEAYWLGEPPSAVVDLGPMGERETITLATVYYGRYLKYRVDQFNKTNRDYKIDVIHYMDGRDEIDAIRQFTIDLAHDPADIIVLTSEKSLWSPHTSIPIHSYAHKGIFAVLYEFMDGDATFNRADYLPNVLKALEMDGRLYTIFPTFALRVIRGKTSDLGDVSLGWTIDEFISFLDTKPEAELIIGDWTKEDFIANMMEFYFTDPESGGMRFDREAFLKILKAAERFPKTCPYDSGDLHWFDLLVGLRDGYPLLGPGRLRGSGGSGLFREEWHYEYLYFGEEISYKGFPSPTGSGTYFEPELRLAIAEKSQWKDGAWEFIKFTMNDGYSWVDTQEMPIKISLLKEWLDATLVNPLNILGEEYEHFTYTEDGAIIYPGNNPPELNAKIMEVITSTTVIAPNDRVVSEIIREEVAFYLAGQKTPDQVADIIENRVGIYLAELD